MNYFGSKYLSKNNEGIYRIKNLLCQHLVHSFLGQEASIVSSECLLLPNIVSYF